MLLYITVTVSSSLLLTGINQTQSRLSLVPDQIKCTKNLKYFNEEGQCSNDGCCWTSESVYAENKENSDSQSFFHSDYGLSECCLSFSEDNCLFRSHTDDLFNISEDFGQGDSNLGPSWCNAEVFDRMILKVSGSTQNMELFECCEELGKSIDLVDELGSLGMLQEHDEKRKFSSKNAEKVEKAVPITCGITQNTGKKRGRKKVYKAQTEEEDLQMKRSRNNEACGKYRYSKKRKLEELFKDEKELMKKNKVLKDQCKEMENEKKLLLNLVLLLKKLKK